MKLETLGKAKKIEARLTGIRDVPDNIPIKQFLQEYMK